MKLIFLGTGHGWPTKERSCQCFLLEAGENRYLIDAGASVADCLNKKEIPFDSIKGVFITHMHGDHFGGLFHFLTLCCYKYKDASLDIYYPEKRAISAFQNLLSFDVGNELETERIRMHSMQEGIIFQDDTVTVTAFPTKHLEAQNRPSYGYLIEAEGKKVYFTGDLHHHDICDFPKWLNHEPVDAVVSECGHFTPEALIKKLQQTKAKHLFVTHVCPTEQYKTLKVLSETQNIPLILPFDGSEYLI